MTEWQINESKLVNEPKKERQICKYYMPYITEWTQQTRPDTVADKHKQNINLLFCNNHRDNKALVVSNTNNKGWKNFSRLIIMLLVSEFTKWKFYQIGFGFLASITQDNINIRVLFLQKIFLSQCNKQKSPHRYPNLISKVH